VELKSLLAGGQRTGKASSGRKSRRIRRGFLTQRSIPVSLTSRTINDSLSQGNHAKIAEAGDFLSLGTGTIFGLASAGSSILDLASWPGFSYDRCALSSVICDYAVLRARAVIIYGFGIYGFGVLVPVPRLKSHVAGVQHPFGARINCPALSIPTLLRNNR
jgi:hypothetical protein